MPARILILDTSLLCCYLQVPGKETCGSGTKKWDYERIKKLLDNEKGATWVLPLATIIETGNHIAQSAGDRYGVAKKLANHIADSADGASPWALFSDQAELWSADKMKSLAETWPILANQRISIGDATIKDVAEHYAKANYDVKIITADEGLKSYEPAMRPRTPRRRQ